MRLYAELGRRDASLRQYQVCIDVLRRELDTEPEEDTRRLYQDILGSRSVAATTGVVVSGDVAGDEPRMVGRVPEIETLNRAVDQACGAVGQGMIVVGEAGIGKSRLVREMALHAAKAGALVMTGHAYPGAQGLPYAAWVEAMRSERLTEDPDIRARLGPIWAGELARLLPELAPAAEGPVADLRLFEAVARFVDCVSASRPVIVVLEDLHWADEMSLRLLAMASRRLRATPVLLVGTARDDELEEREPLRDLLRHETVTRLNLGPLSRPETSALVRALAARRPEALVAELADRVWEGCGGNPFVAVETIRALGHTTVLDAPGALPVPERVRELVGARLERLGDAGQRLVAAAAVVGRDVTFDLLRSAAGMSVESAVDGVEELVRHRVLRAVGERFDFVHDRIREVVAGGLLGPRRCLLHRQVAEAIESLHADELPAHAAALGMHYLEGEVWARALAYLRQAGNGAVTHAAYRDAAPHFEHALAALERLPIAERRIEDTVDLRLEFAGCLVILGELDRGDGLLREALAAALAAEDRRRLHRVLEFCGNQHWWMAEYDRAEQVFAHSRSLTAPGHEPSQIESWCRAVNRHAQGAYRAALELLDQAARKDAEGPPLAAVPGGGGPRRPASLTFFRVSCLVELGRFDEALGRAEDDFQQAETVPHAYRLSLAAASRGLVNLRRGEAAAAIGLLEHGLTLAEESSARAAIPMVTSWLGAAYAAVSRGPEALSVLERSVKRPVPWLRGACHAALAEAYLQVGRIDDADPLAEETLAWTGETGERGTHAWLLWLSAEIRARRSVDARAGDGRREAEARYLRALALARDLEMRPLVARCHLGIGSLGGGAGDRAQRREHLETARLTFGEMGMRSWQERAAAALAAIASA
jgi:tetratricopeptide (TPR) repeat protein